MKSARSNSALVTGATGFIGSHLVGFLLAKGWNVVGTYGAPDSKQTTQMLNARFAQCDLRDRQRVKQLFEGPGFSHVFHLGAQSVPGLSWKDPVSTFESNVMGSLHLLEALRKVKSPP